MTLLCTLPMCCDITLCIIPLNNKSFSRSELAAEGGHGRMGPSAYFLYPWSYIKDALNFCEIVEVSH